jgi:hypothetical protein
MLLIPAFDGSIANDCGTVLLAPTLALTALNCVTNPIFSGNEQGSAEVCARVGPFYPTVTMVASWNGEARSVVKIIDDGQTDICQGDLVFLELDRPITDVPFPKLQLDSPPGVNDGVTECGQGATDEQCTNINFQFGRLPTCDDGKILLNGAASGFYAPDNATFPVGNVVSTNQACSDNGGGLYADSDGALLGNMTYSFQPDKTKLNSIKTPCYACDQDVSESVLLWAHKDFVASAFNQVGLSPWRQGHPQPGGIGGACTDALDCNSQLCIELGSTNVCSQYCDTTACPQNFSCTPAGSHSVCVAAVNPNPASCTASSGSLPRDDKQVCIGLIAMGFFASAVRRRRKEGRRS